jgi:hypothetical protein
MDLQTLHKAGRKEVNSQYQDILITPLTSILSHNELALVQVQKKKKRL